MLCLPPSWWLTVWGRASSLGLLVDMRDLTQSSYLHTLQASNPLYRKPISTHTVDFTFNKFNKSYNGTVD